MRSFGKVSGLSRARLARTRCAKPWEPAQLSSIPSLQIIKGDANVAEPGVPKLGVVAGE